MAQFTSPTELGQLATAMVAAAAFEDWDAAQSLAIEAAADGTGGISSSMFFAALLANALITLADVFEQPLDTVIGGWTNTVMRSLEGGPTAPPVPQVAVPREAIVGSDPDEFINLGQSISLVSARRVDVSLWVRALSDATVLSWHDDNRGVLVRRLDAETWVPGSNLTSHPGE